MEELIKLKEWAEKNQKSYYDSEEGHYEFEYIDYDILMTYINSKLAHYDEPITLTKHEQLTNEAIRLLNSR